MSHWTSYIIYGIESLIEFLQF